MSTDTMNWMSETPGIQNLPLWNICLPATHDTGTYDLTNALTQEPDTDERAIINYLKGVVKEIESIQKNSAYTYIADPQTWVYENVIPYIKGIMTANGHTVGKQLAGGIRCLDLRVYIDPSSTQFYTYHTLVGSPLTSVLSDLQSFLQNSQAEIVYVTLGHLRGFDDQAVADLCELVKSYVGDFAYTPQMGYNPFDQTYEQIVTLGGSAAPRSRVILVLGVATPPDPLFWPMIYSPVDNDQNGGQGIVSGVYANTDGLGNMISDQSGKFQARTPGVPFALFQILTPQSAQVIYGLMSLLYTAFTQLGKSILSIEPAIGRAFIDYANTSLSGPVPEYMSLQQLSQLADANLLPMVYGNLLNGLTGANPLSFIYVDFYEVTSAVDIAINLTSGGLSGRSAKAVESAEVLAG